MAPTWWSRFGRGLLNRKVGAFSVAVPRQFIPAGFGVKPGQSSR